MFPSLLVKLRPDTPWRISPNTGARDQVDPIYHSDNLYSAITHAMDDLGHLEEWLDATARAAAPAVCFTSCYPFTEQGPLIVPPRNLWPPPPSSRVRWKGARFVPLSLVETLVKDPEARIREDEGWVVEAESECLLKPGRTGRVIGPFRVVSRTSAAVDRYTGIASDPVSTACMEFIPGCGLWLLVAFSDEGASEMWRGRVQSCFRLLADSGFGAERSRGWGHAQQPEFLDGRFPDLLIRGVTVSTPKAAPEGDETEAAAPVETAYWMLSLFTPGEQDNVDWTRGSYGLTSRSGRVESRQRSGDEKLSLRMVTEGSVLFAPEAPKGSARNVAPEGFPHPVYRAGFGLSIPIAWRVVA